MAYYNYPNHQSKASGAQSPVTWNWSSPPQAPARGGDWASPLLDYSQPETRDWSTPPPPQGYQQNSSYAGNMRMVYNNGYGFHGDLVRPRHAFQQPVLSSTPRPDLYSNQNSWPQGNHGVSTKEHGLTEVLASYATRKSTVVFMDSKSKQKGGYWTSKNRLLLLIFLTLVCIGTASFVRSHVNFEKTSPSNGPVLTSASPTTLARDKPEADESSFMTPSNGTILASASPTTLAKDKPEAEKSSFMSPSNGTVLASASPTTLARDTPLAAEEKSSFVPIKEEMPNVIYTFDDDDKDLANEARVETVIEKEIIVAAEKSQAKGPNPKQKADKQKNYKYDAKPQPQPQRRRY